MRLANRRAHEMGTRLRRIIIRLDIVWFIIDWLVVNDRRRRADAI